MAAPRRRFTSIARPVEPQVPTNLAILILMGVALVGLSITAIVRGAPLVDALLGGLVGSLVVFATWALGRDLAPDDNPAAFVALLPVTALVLLGVDPALMGPDLNHDFDPEFLDDPTPPATGPEPFPVALP